MRLRSREQNWDQSKSSEAQPRKRLPRQATEAASVGPDLERITCIARPPTLSKPIISAIGRWELQELLLDFSSSERNEGFGGSGMAICPKMKICVFLHLSLELIGYILLELHLP